MFHDNGNIIDDLEPNTNSTGLGNYLVETYITLFYYLTEMEKWDKHYLSVE